MSVYLEAEHSHLVDAVVVVWFCCCCHFCCLVRCLCVDGMSWHDFLIGKNSFICPLRLYSFHNKIRLCLGKLHKICCNKIKTTIRKHKHTQASATMEKSCIFIVIFVEHLCSCCVVAWSFSLQANYLDRLIFLCAIFRVVAPLRFMSLFLRFFLLSFYFFLSFGGSFSASEHHWDIFHLSVRFSSFISVKLFSFIHINERINRICCA